MRLRVIDIETSGGKPSEIIEIAAVDVVATAEGWLVEPPRSRLFKPRGEISFHAMAIHHLTPDDFGDDTAVCCDVALEAFIVEGGVPDALVAHNARFESQHISPHVTRALPWLCTLKCARALWSDAPGYSNQVLRYWRGLTLDPLLAMPPHRAAPDAWVTAHTLVDLLATASFEELMAHSGASRPLDRVPFGRYRGQDWSRVPRDYLRWLVGEADMDQDVVARARSELIG